LREPYTKEDLVPYPGKQIKISKDLQACAASNPDKVFDGKMLSVPKVKTLLTFSKFQSSVPGTRAASTHVCRILNKI
jgi:hypothetical protein